MRFSRHCLALALALLVATGRAQGDATCSSRGLGEKSVEAPLVTARTLANGVVTESNDGTPVSEVMGCCSNVATSDCDNKIGVLEPQVIGTMPQMNQQQALEILESAKRAWKGGMGVWPQMSLKARVEAVEDFLNELQGSREDIVNVLMWEIGKNQKDAESEFDRTVHFVKSVITVIRQDPEFNASWQSIGATRAFVRRAAVGIIMCLGPFNYPLNETYATLIPALLMGNVVIMKIPTVGGLAHLLTMKAFAKALPPGTIQFISGSGRTTMPPLMSTGDVDGLAFIGGSGAADNLIQQHPHPHRLKLFLQLEAKNMGIFLPDLFESDNASMLESALDEAVLGSLSYNGQRCTALKLLFVSASHAKSFANELANRVEALSVGLPWQTWDNGSCSQITPLPNQKRVQYMKQLIKDATEKGAKVLNENGGTVVGGPESTLMIPAILYPVTPEMNVYHEEQFGPVVPIVPYDDIETILKYGREGQYGQQCSIFTSKGTETAAKILDSFSSVFGKININSQCGRSPDTLPFSGRRSSAMGIMSVTDALREFSIPTVVSYKDKGLNGDIVNDIQKSSSFMESL